jgi:hypothetical protein
MSLPPRTCLNLRYPFGVRFDEFRPERVATLPVGLEP